MSPGSSAKARPACRRLARYDTLIVKRRLFNAIAVVSAMLFVIGCWPFVDYVSAPPTTGVTEAKGRTTTSMPTTSTTRAAFGVTANPASATNILLSWKPVDFATGYRVEISFDGRTFHDQVDVVRTEVDVLDLDPGTKYFFRVIATNGAHDLASSNTISATTPEK